jgi:hypothetical protein
MRFPARSLAIALALASSTLPACADHPQQPTAPALGAVDLTDPAVLLTRDSDDDRAHGRRFHYVSPTGSKNQKGSRGQPFDLATALGGGNGAVTPGDVLFLRGGTYTGEFRSTLAGTAQRPIIVRAVPGEHATIDGSLLVYGSHVAFWGLEIMQSNPLANPGRDALETFGDDERFINMIVHDAGGQGVTFGRGTGYSEIYGSIVYNNGTVEELEHGIYATNDGGEKVVADNIVFNNLAYGIHVFASDAHAAITNVRVEGNTAFNNGTISARGPDKSNLLIGAERDVPVTAMSALRNLLYYSPSADEGQNLRIGLADRPNMDVVVRDNYVVGGQTVFRIEDWQRAVVEGNTFVGSGRMVRSSGMLSGFEWRSNSHFRDPATTSWNHEGSSRAFEAWRAMTGLGGTDVVTAGTPTTNRIFVRRNAYEPWRATVAVVNWEGKPSVSVNMAGILIPGMRYEVWNAQRPLDAPVASGVYRRGSIDLPMDGVAPPVATGRPGTPPRTGPAFDVFIVSSAIGDEIARLFDDDRARRD